MSPLKLFSLGLMVVVVSVACQQKNPKRTSLRDGRGLRGEMSGANQDSPGSPAGGTCGSFSESGKRWGEVTSTAGDQAFAQEINFLMSPVLEQLPAEDQLGFVSSQSGQATGVRFWGNAQPMAGQAQGPLDLKTAQIRIEIFDDRACQTRANGTQRPMIPIHISDELPDFRRAEGNISATNTYLYFEDRYGAIILQGSYNNQYFTGTMSYTVTGNSGTRVLGRFQVPTCGFFVCN